MEKRSFSRTPSSWDPQDDLLLRHLKEEKKLGWKEISTHFSSRTPNACQFRWRRLRSVTPGGTPAPAAAQAAPTRSPGARKASSSSSSSSSGSSSSHSAEQVEPVSEPVDPSSGTAEPAQPVQQAHAAQPARQAHEACENDFEWSVEEEDLLIYHRERKLSFAEINILLPSKTEDEITSKISSLDAGSSNYKKMRSQSQSSLTPKRLAPSRSKSFSLQMPVMSPLIKRKYSMSDRYSLQNTNSTFSDEE